MSATNSRIRRAILDVLWDEGPMTKEEVAVALAERKGVRRVPSPHSLSALLCKSHAVIVVGKKEVQNIVGVKSKHALYDLDREVVMDQSEIRFIREPSTMTPKEKALARKCACGRTRIFPPDSEECLTCQRLSC